MEKKIVDNYIVSLLAKPFVVLTGNSGTGKTRLALRVAEQLEKKNYKVNTRITLEVNRQGKILNKREVEMRDLCVDSNVFIAIIGEKEFEVQVETNIQINCDDRGFWESVEKNETSKIILLVAVRIPLEKRHVLIPVEAEWTDSRSLLGYVNPFGPDGKTVYEITPIVELILKALHPDNRNLPHFIILDEMNLSHVERYFSTFLSAMEANRSTSAEKGIALIGKAQLAIIIETLHLLVNVEKKILDSAKLLFENNDNITLPPNVFIVGTVNVDETTYTLSPKILDRAHIIELETVHPTHYFDGTFGIEGYTFNGDIVLGNFKRSIEYREMEYQGINTLSQLKSTWGKEEDFENAKKEMETLLSGIYSILRTVNFDFGYRVFKEVMEYIYFAILYNQTDSDWGTHLDNALLQKVLPKLHGNRRQLSDSLENLTKYINQEAFEDPMSNLKVQERSETYVISTNNNIIKNKLDLPRSLAKLEKMRSTLNNVGYTSFIS